MMSRRELKTYLMEAIFRWACITVASALPVWINFGLNI